MPLTMLGVCYADHRCAHRPVARFHFGNGNAPLVCQRHLDMWLDMTDDGEIDEPVALTWLAGQQPAPTLVFK
jgi:hypothetical protein